MSYFGGPETYPGIIRDLQNMGYAITSIMHRDRDRACRVFTKMCGFPVQYVWAGDDLLVDASRWSVDRDAWAKFMVSAEADSLANPDAFVAAAISGAY